MRHPVSLAVLLGLLLLGVEPSGRGAQPEPRNFSLRSAVTPVTNDLQRNTWQLIVDDLLGVAGLDPVGHYIGYQAALRAGVPNWFPLDGYKHILVGRLGQFEFYDGLGQELDWCNRIIPSAKTAHLLRDVLPMVWWPESWYLFSCETGNDCMEAELTPDEDFYENEYFSAREGWSTLVGKTIAAYGPWVREQIHGNRPEIHPSELMWWREDTAAARTVVLAALQDDSNRYDRPGDFESGILYPWAVYPRRGEFRMAFDVSPSGPARRFIIREHYAHNVVTGDDPTAWPDADDGRTHALEYDGRIVVTVEETQAEDNNLGVVFSEVTRSADGSRLQGYIVITSKIGRGDRGDEGFHVLKVTEPLLTAAVPRAPELRIMPSGRGGATKARTVAVPGSLRSEVVNGRRRLVGDVRAEAPSGSVSAKALSFALTGRLAVDSQWAGGDQPRAWAAVQQTLGAGATGTRPPGRFVGVDRVDITSQPAYAPVRAGKPSPGEDSPFARELNAALRVPGAASRVKTFGSDRPIGDVTWRFEAKTLPSGKAVPVRMGRAPGRPGEIVIEPEGGKAGAAKVTIVFPASPAGVVYEVAASAAFTDVFGHKASLQQRVWSHALVVDGSDPFSGALLAWTAGLAGLAPDRLMTASRLERAPKAPFPDTNATARRARMLRLYLRDAAGDGRLDVGELQRAGRMASALRQR